jgi:hypothetical protein
VKAGINNAASNPDSALATPKNSAKAIQQIQINKVAG